MHIENANVSASSSGSLINERTFPVDRETLFRALTDPEVLPRWWGPEGFRNEFELFEPWSGGAWRFRMYGPDGAEYRMEKSFLEVTPPGRIVVRHLEPAQHRFELEMTLSPADGGTRLAWTMRFDDPAELERLREILHGANEQNFDRLAAELAALRHSTGGES